MSNVEFAIRTLVDGGGFTSPPPGPDDLSCPTCRCATWPSGSSRRGSTPGAGVQVNFAESIATVQANLREIQPTVLFGVPRIWEKILATVTIRLNAASLVKRLNARLWLAVADRIGVDARAHRRPAHGRHAAGVRASVGSSSTARCASASACAGCATRPPARRPIAPDVLKFFMGIGVPMHEVYGMTENTAVATGNRPGRVKLGTVGEPQAGVELRIDRGRRDPHPARRGVRRLLPAMPAATARAMTADGWLHTGDVGEWVDGTHVKITDRAKDIIITSGGKNIAPSRDRERDQGFAVRQGGDRHRRPPRLPVRPHRHRAGHRGRVGAAARDGVHDLPRPVRQAGGARARPDASWTRSTPGARPVEQVREFRMLPKELDHEDGELTATQKVKRSAIAETFGDLVDDIYAARKKP